jgi:transposase
MWWASDWQWDWIGSGRRCRRRVLNADKPVHLHDHAPEREWRHLDAMGFETILRARMPQLKCEEHGVDNAAVPWALPHGRLRGPWKRRSLRWVKACASVQAACERLKLAWKQVHALMKRAVQRGLARRKAENLKAVGFDEKSFQEEL